MKQDKKFEFAALAAPLRSWREMYLRSSAIAATLRSWREMYSRVEIQYIYLYFSAK